MCTFELIRVPATQAGPMWQHIIKWDGGFAQLCPAGYESVSANPVTGWYVSIGEIALNEAIELLADAAWLNETCDGENYMLRDEIVEEARAILTAL